MSDDTTGAGGDPARSGSDEAARSASDVLEPWLRQILRCPACHGELADGTGPGGGAELVCTNHECALAYRLDDGVPVLLVDEARRVG